MQGGGADTTMAVPNMLEIVPRGINKWVGMQLLLEDLDIERSALMSCGDGSNDLQLVANSGIGVAMGNAVNEVGSKEGLNSPAHVPDACARASSKKINSFKIIIRLMSDLNDPFESYLLHVQLYTAALA